MRQRFGSFVMEPDRLTRDGITVPLAAKPLGVLRALLAKPGEIVTKDELVERVWGGVHVSDESLSRSVYALRNALEDRYGSPRYVETLYGRGYRFVGALESGGGEPRPAGARPGVPSDARMRAAHELTLRGRGHLSSSGSQGVPAAAALFEQALAQDPNCVPALVGLGQALTWQRALPRRERRADLERARQLLARAASLAPDDARARGMLGAIASMYDHDVETADAEFRAAIDSDPDEAVVCWLRGIHLLSVGRFREALDDHDAACTLASGATTFMAERAIAAYFASGPAAARARVRGLEHVERTVPAVAFVRAIVAGEDGADPAAVRELARIARERPRLHPAAAVAFASAGLADEARAELASVREHAAAGTAMITTAAALAAAKLGDVDEAYTWLEQGPEHLCPYLAYAGIAPDFAILRGERRYATLLRRIGREFLLEKPPARLA